MQPREISFPNPVDRSDLPRRKARWRYIIAGVLLAVILLSTAFLPQLVSSRIGRRLVKSYLESKYKGTVWVAPIQTSWSGPTTIVGFSFTDPEGRQFRFRQLDSRMSVTDLLFGDLDLKTATVKELHCEYVVDYGDGTDSLDRVSKGAKPAAASGAHAPGTPPKPLAELPQLAGHITLEGATFILTRGQIQPEKQFRTAYRSVRFFKLDGSLDIKSLDQPFAVELAGRVGEDNANGPVTLTGTLDLGASGKLDTDNLAADIKVQMKDVPNAATTGAGSLVWVMLPLLPVEDFTEMFGRTLNTLDVTLKASEDGELHLADLSIKGTTPGGKPATLTGQPVVDLTRRPRVLSLGEPLTLSVGLTRPLAQTLAPLNPLLQEAADGGQLELTLTDLSLPMTGSQKKMSAAGSYAITAGRLASSAVTSPDALPAELTTRLQLLLGNTEPALSLDVPTTRFAIESGVARPEPTPFTVAGTPLTLSGQAELKGRTDYTLTLPRPPVLQSSGLPDQLSLRLTGTLDDPALDLAAVQADAKASAAVDKHLVALSERKREHLLQLSEKRIDAMISPFDKRQETGDKEQGGK